MLPQNLIDDCEEIKEKYENYEKIDKSVSKGIGAIFLSLVASGILFFMSISDILYTIELSYIAIGIFVISIIITIIKARNFKNFKLSETERVILSAYNTHLYLEKYLQKGVEGSRLDYLNHAKDEIKSIVYDIVPGWRNYSRFNTLIPNLDNSIGVFVDNISKLEMAIENLNLPKNIIQEIMQELIKFLLKKNEMNINDINNVFLPLKSIPSKISIEEKIKIKIVNSLRKKSTRIHISVSAGLSLLGFLSWKGLEALAISPDTSIIVVNSISSVPLIMYWIFIIKSKLDRD